MEAGGGAGAGGGTSGELRGGTSTPGTWPGPRVSRLAISTRGGSISRARPTSTTREIAMHRCPAAPKPAATRALRGALGVGVRGGRRRGVGEQRLKASNRVRVRARVGVSVASGEGARVRVEVRVRVGAMREGWGCAGALRVASGSASSRTTAWFCAPRLACTRLPGEAEAEAEAEAEG